ncbi:hypothetical protein [Pseudofrankia saprophytica]|nr:hypothetical protein [Pseudofrankia saprophytica]
MGAGQDEDDGDEQGGAADACAAVDREVCAALDLVGVQFGQYDDLREK